MQFHLNGYRFGDPESILDEEQKSLAGASGPLPKEVDVLIVGAGPAGLTLAAQLAVFADIKTCLVERKEERLLRGHANGVACRSMEMFQAFGFAHRVLREAYWVNEISFWQPDPERTGTIARSGRVQDTEDGLSEFPHVILNQARVHDFYLELMRKAPGSIEPFYSRRLYALSIDAETAADPASHPVAVKLEHSELGVARTETLRARYVVGCDGADSAVRRLIGRNLKGESFDQGQGVMDVLAITDFPDVRLKCVITAPDGGSILLIPREGGHLFRLYVELDSLEQGEPVANRNWTLDHLIAAAERIFKPYKLDIKEVAWWSIYAVGQRLCDTFDDIPADEIATRAPRVFIAGDAGHTHSAKAGQGMNVSMQDGFNLGWKLAAVLRGRADPDLLHSYSRERRAVARALIDFDHPDGRRVTASEVRNHYVRHNDYRAGVATRYPHSRLTGKGEHQALAAGFAIGARFHSAPVTRLADARPMELGHAATADGAFRLYVFADSAPTDRSSALNGLCDFLSRDPASPLIRHTPAKAEPDSAIDLRVILQQAHRTVSLESLHELLLPAKGQFGLRDHEKVFCPALPPTPDIFETRGIDRSGCIVIVRPDQYVAEVLPLDAHEALADYFAGVLRKLV